MKFFILASLFSSTFALADFNCSQYLQPVGSVHFSLSEKTYHLTYSKGTRVSYSATYKKVGETHTRIGKVITLKLVEDDSTFQDMPMTLEISQKYGPANLSIHDLFQSDVHFKKEECEINL